MNKFSFEPPKIPELKFFSNTDNNWPEVERFLYCNSVPYNKAYHEARAMGFVGEMWRLRIAVYLLAVQEQNLNAIAIKQAENAVSPGYFVAPMLKSPSLFSRIIYLIRTGNWI